MFVLCSQASKAQDFIVTKSQDTLDVEVLGQNDSLIFFRRNSPGANNEKIARSEVKGIFQLKLNPGANVWPQRDKDNFFPVYASFFTGYSHHLRSASKFVSTRLAVESAVNFGVELSTLTSERLSIGLRLFHSRGAKDASYASPNKEYVVTAGRKFTFLSTQLGINLSRYQPMKHKMLLQFGYAWMSVNARNPSSYSSMNSKGITAGMGFEFSVLYRKQMQIFLRPNVLMTLRNKGKSSYHNPGYYSDIRRQSSDFTFLRDS